jgi:DnaJ-class molecular chaperone
MDINININKQRCPECGGKGEVMVDTSNVFEPLSPTRKLVRCQYCNGTGYI